MTTPGSSSSAEVEQLSSGTEGFVRIVGPRLQLVEELLELNFRSEITTIRDVGTHILDGGGKRLRPMLLLMVSDMIGYRGNSDITYAAVVEFIHTATLVHDDIIDEAEVRRGRTSINYRWGNHLTVLVGDYLYTHAMKMALDEGNLEILKLLSDATIRMIEGEILGVETNGRADLTIDEYLEIAGRKTGALFAASCQIPGLLIGAPEEVIADLYEYGYNLGICFQLIDDLLDFTSSTEVLGKPALSDLKEGKVTLPLIFALPRATKEERLLVERVAAERSLGAITPPELIGLAEKYDTIEQTREFAKEYASRARLALARFPATKSREALERALEFVIERTS